MKVFPSGAAFQVFDTLDSTSLEAKRRAQAGETGPCWIIAIRQTAAYGRRQRAWRQEVGDLASTLLFSPTGPVESLGQLSFVASLALAYALDEYASSDQVTLKWPNDVMLDKCKCAGILLENLDGKIAIGIGVNIVTAPDNLPYPAARLIDFAPAPPPQELAGRIDSHFFALYHRWRDKGFAPVRERWLARATGLGEEITVRLPNEEFSGVFEGIDDGGGLLLHSPVGRRTVAAGEVFFGRDSMSEGVARN